MTDLYDCGHAKDEPGAHTPDGRHICRACAEREEYAAFMADTYEVQRDKGAFFAYISTDGRELTTWTGYKLARVTALWQTNAGFHGYHEGGRWYFTAKDANGRLWHGNSPGKGMYARARLYKSQPNQQEGSECSSTATS